MAVTYLQFPTQICFSATFSFKPDPDSIKLNQHVKCLGQRSFSSITHPTALLGQLKLTVETVKTLIKELHNTINLNLEICETSRETCEITSDARRQVCISTSCNNVVFLQLKQLQNEYK